MLTEVFIIGLRATQKMGEIPTLQQKSMVDISSLLS
jgi:hypothetical protein